MAPPKLILSYADYSRIFRVVYSMLDGRAHTDRACIFFAVAGAYLLQQHHKLEARPVSGSAVYLVDSKAPLAATFGVFDDEGMLVSTSEAFHCWVEVGGYAIDFMAPVFRENLKAAGIENNVVRKMFQRPLSEVAGDDTELNADGDFALFPSEERTKAMLANIERNASSRDLLNVCASWYRRQPKNIDKTFKLGSSDKGLETIVLHGPEITGVW